MADYLLMLSGYITAMFCIQYFKKYDKPKIV
jgi:hypothetical protein